MPAIVACRRSTPGPGSVTIVNRPTAALVRAVRAASLIRFASTAVSDFSADASSYASSISSTSSLSYATREPATSADAVVPREVSAAAPKTVATKRFMICLVVVDDGAQSARDRGQSRQGSVWFRSA